MASYAYERQETLKPFTANDTQQNEFKLLEERRQDLKQMLVQEKNRAESPLYRSINEDMLKVVRFLKEQMALIINKIDLIIRSNNIFFEKKKILLKISGIGEVTANSI